MWTRSWIPAFRICQSSGSKRENQHPHIHRSENLRAHLDSSGSGYCWAGSLDHGSDPSGSATGEELLDKRREFQLIEEDFRDRGNYLGTYS